jgi:CRISPR system Cascade subunit CasA
MEFACLQLIVAITQVLLTPDDIGQLKQRILKPISSNEYKSAIEDKMDWFDLNHPKTPFMQFKDVKVNLTPIKKLLAGMADGTNKTFVNPYGLVVGLCSGCSTIALFNTANNCPSVGGDFKAGLRNNTPITVLLKDMDLRKSVWLNVLTIKTLETVMPWYHKTKNQLPNYIKSVQSQEKILTSNIGFSRGLLWQPAHFNLIPSTSHQYCSCCGIKDTVYKLFYKEKFKYKIEGCWPHPLSPRTFAIYKGKKKTEFPSFRKNTFAWTHISHLLIPKENEKEGQQPAPVIEQARLFLKSNRIRFIVGGYRNNQATILERRHEFFDISQGWGDNDQVIEEIVNIGLSYKQVLRKALYLFAQGIKGKIPGTGINLCDKFDIQYYQQTQFILENAFANIDFSKPKDSLDSLHQKLTEIIKNLFIQATDPYRHEPKMLKALSVARRSLFKSLNELMIKEQGGATNEK